MTVLSALESQVFHACNIDSKPYRSGFSCSLKITQAPCKVRKPWQEARLAQISRGDAACTSSGKFCPRQALRLHAPAPRPLSLFREVGGGPAVCPGVSFSDDFPYTWDVTVLEPLPRAWQKLDFKIYQGSVSGQRQMETPHRRKQGPQRPRTESDKDR